VVASGRGAGERPRSCWLWLPGPDGSVTAAAGAGAAAGAAEMAGPVVMGGARLISSG
jgi:hypothetical protein